MILTDDEAHQIMISMTEAFKLLFATNTRRIEQQPFLGCKVLAYIVTDNVTRIDVKVNK